MRSIKIKFVDFWYGFSPENNYFFKTLSSHFNLQLSDEPEILIYSCYGKTYLQYNCVRLFYSGENVRPDFSGCDFAISFDHSKHARHLRLPLYVLYIELYNSSSNLKKELSREEAIQIWRSKKKFCCMVISNGNSQKRLDFFDKLSGYKKVDSGGKTRNNIGGPVKDKMEFIKDYRFVFAFENSSHPGYVTEKILEPLIVNSIPLYWGDPLVQKDFNNKSFLYLGEGKSEDDFLKEIIKIDADEDMAVEMLMEPKFSNPEIPGVYKEKLIAFFENIVLSKDSIRPVAKTNKRYLHAVNNKKTYYANRIKDKLTGLLFKH